MLTALKFKNFRGFSSFDAKLKPVTVVVGANSSGKTTVLHAIRMAVESLSRARERGTPHEETSGRIEVCKNLIVDDFTRLVPVDDWAELFRGGLVSEGTTLNIDAAFDGDLTRLEIFLDYARNRQPKLAVRVTCAAANAAVSGIAKKSARRPEALREAIAKSAPRALLVPAFYGVTRAEEHRSQGLLFRLLAGGDQSRVVRNLITRLPKDRFDGLNRFIQSAVGATITWRTSGDELDSAPHLNVYFRDTDGELELSSAGAGLVNLIALYASMANLRATEDPARSILYLLDEPEAHLHPKLQGDVGASMAQLASEFGAQLILATHSIEIVNRMGDRPDAQLLAVSLATGATPLDTEQDVIGELSRWCDLTPFTSLTFLASRRVVFHEGPSDAAILAACARVYFRNKPADLKSFNQWTFVSLDGVGNANASAVLGTVLTPKVFPNLSEKRAVRAVCVFDRDAERAPGGRKLDKLSKNHFEAYERVWSRHSIESLFLDVACLLAWLSQWMPAEVDQAKLASAIATASTVADANRTLEDEAVDAIALAEMRQNGAKPLAAQKIARERARKEPVVWQKGRSRARTMLKLIRAELPKNVQNRVRASIADLVELPAEVVYQGDVTQLVPQDIRELLDWMVATTA